jgi:sn-glycerol 3-phosphate transport system ATP-binding protein
MGIDLPTRSGQHCLIGGPPQLQSVIVRALTKRWGETTAVDEVSFTVLPGQLTVLLGPSGCGKSTTLRLIAGLDEPTAGTIEIGGKDVSGFTGAARGVAMVFQSYALLPHLTAAENITFGLSVRRTPRTEIARRLERVAGLLDLKTLLGRKPGQLSGGQQQRVALGRALIAEAPVCLLDEPLSNLDAQLRHDSALKFSNVRFFAWQRHRYTAADLKSLSDKALEDIGFRLDRCDLNAVKPFWMA